MRVDRAAARRRNPARRVSLRVCGQARAELMTKGDMTKGATLDDSVDTDRMRASQKSGIGAFIAARPSCEMRPVKRAL